MAQESTLPANDVDYFEAQQPVIDDLLGRFIATAVLFFGSAVLLACSMCMVRRHSGRSPHPFLPNRCSLWVKIALGTFAIFTAFDTSASVVGYLSLRPISFDTFLEITISYRLSGVAALFEHAAHAVLLVALAMAATEVVDATADADADDLRGARRAVLPTGITIAKAVAGLMVLLAVPVFALDAAYLARADEADDLAATALGHEKTAAELAAETALYERAASLDLVRRRLQAALECLYLAAAVAMAVVGVVVAVVWRRRLERSARKPAMLILACNLLWLVRNVWRVVESVYLDDVNEKYYSELPTLRFRSTVDALINALPTFIVFSILIGLGMKKAVDSENAEWRERREGSRRGHREVNRVIYA